jgi:hypothetical protein
MEISITVRYDNAVLQYWHFFTTIKYTKLKSYIN